MDGRLELIESALDRVLPQATERPTTLSAAMRWAVEGGGKRIRPQICLAAAEKDLATCIVGSADEEGVKALLGIDPERRVHCVIAVGHGAEPFKMKKDRLPYEELVTERR